MNFNTAFDRLVSHEGSYINDPMDPGGETKFGISKRSYPLEDIKNLTLERAREIYLLDFWDALGSTHPALKFQVFDFAVNSGIQTAIRKLQQAIGVADDGHWGPASSTKLSTFRLDDVLMLYLSERLNFMTSLRTFDTFGRGWSRRIAANLKFAAQDNEDKD
jgi:lysozyme family protein